MSGRILCALVATTLLLLHPGRALGSASVDLTDCPVEWQHRLPELLSLELSSLARERHKIAVTETGSIGVGVRCTDSIVTLTISDQRLRTSSTQQRDLASVSPEGRARAVALAIVEMIDALWLDERGAAEPTQPTTPVQPAPPPTPALPTPAPNTTPTRMLPDGNVSQRAPAREGVSLTADGSLRRIGQGATWAYGLAFTLQTPLYRRLYFFTEVRGDRGTAAVEVGDVEINSASASFALLWGSRWGDMRWGAGAGGRVGLARLSGRPTSSQTLAGDSLTGPWGGPMLTARLLFTSPRHRWAWAVGADAGVITLPLLGHQDSSRKVFALEGAWFGLSLGVGLSLTHPQ